MMEEKVTTRDVALAVVETRPPELKGIVTKFLYHRDDTHLIRLRDEVREEFPFLTIEEANQVLGALYKDESLDGMHLPDDCVSVKDCENLLGMCRCFEMPTDE